MKTRSARRKKAGMGKRSTSYCSAKVYTDSGELGTMKIMISQYTDICSKNFVSQDEIECGVSNSGFF